MLFVTFYPPLLLRKYNFNVDPPPSFFLFARDTCHSLRAEARGCARTGEFPCTDHGACQKKTVGCRHRVPAPPATMVPSREPPYRTRPPGTTPTSAAGLRQWKTPLPEDFSSRNPPSGDPLKNPGGPIRGGTAGPHLPWWRATGQESLPQPRRAWGDDRAANPPAFLGHHEGTQWHRCR